MTTEAKIHQLLSDHLGVPLAEVTGDSLLVPSHDERGRVVASAKPDLGADSLDIVEIVMAVEEDFKIEISDDEAEPLNTGTVADLVRLVEAKLAA